MCLPMFSKSQNTSDHLIPDKSIWSLFDYQFVYYSNIRNVLMKDLSNDPKIRLVSLPSFSPESVLQIDKSTLIYRIPNQMIWSNNNQANIEVKEYRVEIDSRSVALIKSLFLKAIRQTRYPETKIWGLDGIYYYFLAWGNGLESGKTWSPNTPNMQKLVEIGEKLIELAKTKTELISFDEDFTLEIENLNKNLE